MEFVNRGVGIMVVTFGRDGAIAATKEGIWRSRPPEIEFVSAVGSGDSFAAAFVYALASGGSVSDALKLGTAAGAANAMYFGAGFCRRADIDDLLERVEMSELTIGMV
jgi:fructose-1-phosphate kinase PfkB-like protein